MIANHPASINQILHSENEVCKKYYLWVYGAISHWAIIASGSPKQIEFYAFPVQSQWWDIIDEQTFNNLSCWFLKNYFKVVFNGISILVG